MSARSRPCEAQVIRSAGAATDCSVQTQRWVLAATILASAISYIDESVVNIALPVIAKDLAAPVALSQWIINAYTLCLAAFLLIGGAVGDRLGRRRIFVVGISVFAIASFWCGISTGIAQLIAARAIQGIGAALLVPCSLAIIGAAFPESARGKAIGTWAGFSAVAAAIGPLLGGWIVDHLSWQVIFLVNPVIAIPTIWIALRHVPESFDPEARPGLDWIGALLAFAGLASLAFGLIELADAGLGSSTVIALTAGVLLMILFVVHERRTSTPMLPLELFRSRLFSGINVLTLLLYGALAGVFFLLPFELIQVHGYSATMAGTVFVPFTIIMAVLSRWAGGLLDRVGARLPLIIGPTIVAIGLGLLAALSSMQSYWLAFLLPITVVGLGMTVTVAPLTTAVISAVPEHQTGIASGVNNAVASVATLLAVVIFAAIALTSFNSALDRHLEEPGPSSGVRQILGRAHGTFAAAKALPGDSPADLSMADEIIRSSLARGIRLATLFAAFLSLAAAGTAALAIKPK
jgi:EmrB/QacA subfamily drug resistance transporter